VIFSKRLHDGQPPQLQFDYLPPDIRTQIEHIWKAAIGTYYGGYLPLHRQRPISNSYWELIDNTL
jgi:hypothetical protein